VAITQEQHEAMVRRLGAEIERLDALVATKEARVVELEAAMERIIAGPYAGQFASAVDVAVEAMKRWRPESGTQPLTSTQS
jgi:hypothetical protein